VLQQVENVASHTILKEKLLSGAVSISALWFDIQTADFMMFSKEEERFLIVNEDSVDHLVKDAGGH
jgi:carbonic anhydrase